MEMIKKTIENIVKEKGIITKQKQINNVIMLTEHLARNYDYWDNSLWEVLLELNEVQLFAIERMLTSIKTYNDNAYGI